MLVRSISPLNGQTSSADPPVGQGAVAFITKLLCIAHTLSSYGSVSATSVLGGVHAFSSDETKGRFCFQTQHRIVGRL